MQAILLPCGLLLADGAWLLKASVADGKTAHKNKKSEANVIMEQPRPRAEEMALAVLVCRSIAQWL